MPEKKKNAQEKKPLDMTTDEAMEYLLGQEGARKLKEGARELCPPPEGEEPNPKASAKSSRKHTSR